MMLIAKCEESGTVFRERWREGVPGRRTRVGRRETEVRFTAHEKEHIYKEKRYYLSLSARPCVSPLATRV
jgi:hypothetical protein